MIADLPVKQALTQKCEVISSAFVQYGFMTEPGKFRDFPYDPELTDNEHRYVDKGHKNGNVVITVEHNNKT